MSDQILYLVEAVTAVDSVGTLETLRYANRGYTTKPSETPPNATYLPRIQSAGTIVREMFSGERTEGASRVGYGEITLANTDGELDTIRDYGFDNRPLIVKTGTPETAYASLNTALVATVSQVTLTKRQVSISLKDRLYELDSQHQTTVYAGNNSLPNGLEGVDDLKGKPKPYLLGKVYNISPPQVNTSRLIYQVSNALVNSIDAVYDGGVTLIQGAPKTLAQFGAAATTFNFTVNTATDVATTTGNHLFTTGDGISVVTSGTLPAPLSASVTYYARVLTATTFQFHPTAADAVANTNRVDITTAGTGTHNVSNNRTALGNWDYVYDAAGSYFRLGSAVVFEITADATQGAAASNRTTAQVLRQLALDAGISSGDIVAGDVTALDAANSSVVGIWFADERTTIQAMDEVAASVGAYYGFDRLGDLRMARFEAPSGTPVLTIDQVNGFNLDRVPNRDGQPTYRVTVNHSKFWTTQTSGLATSVTAANRSNLAQEYRATTTEDTAVLNQHLAAQEQIRNTLLTSASDADTEATRLLTLYKTRRDVYKVTVRLTSEAILALDLNAVVLLRWDRFGLFTGKMFRVIAGEFDFSRNRATLTLWG